MLNDVPSILASDQGRSKRADRVHGSPNQTDTIGLGAPHCSLFMGPRRTGYPCASEADSMGERKGSEMQVATPIQN